MTLSNKRYFDSSTVTLNPNTNPNPSCNQGWIQDFLRGDFCQYKIHQTLVPSDVHVDVIGRGAIGPQRVQGRFQLMNPGF
jgi:hypothetical protein